MGSEALNMQNNCCKAFQKKIAKDKRKNEELQLSVMKDIDSAYISIADKRVRSESPRLGNETRRNSPIEKQTLLAQSAPRIKVV
jgi:hypothetical protein